MLRALLSVSVLLAALPALAVPLAIGGAVVDSRDRPVSGAAVELIPAPPPAEERRLEAAGRAFPEAIAKARTGAPGTFALTAPAAGLFYIKVESPGSIPVSYLFAAVEDVELPAARLRRDTGLTVRVLDPAGKPVAGARVLVEPSRKDMSAFPRDHPWSPALRFGLTGADGRLALPRGEKEAVEVRALAAGLAPGELHLDARQTAAELRLTAACPRAVEVKDAAGRAAAGVWVDSAPWSLGETDAGGRFIVSPPCRQALPLALAAADGRSARTRISPWSGGGAAPALHLRLPPAPAPRTGQVVEKETRRPVVGALVWLPDAPGTFLRSDARGTYTLPHTPSTAERQRLSAAAAGYFQGWGEIQPAGAAPTISLEPAAVVSGRVVDTAGRPVAGAELGATAQGRDAWFEMRPGRARSGADGRFRLTVSPRAPLALEVSAAGFARATRMLPPLPPHGARTEPAIVLARGRTASGRVVDGADQPVAGAEVALTAVEERGANPFRRRGRAGGLDDGQATASTDREGRFTLPNLGGGRYDLTARGAGFATTVVRGLALPAEEGTTDLGTVILQPGVALAGLVVDTQSRPLAGATVKLWQDSSGRGRFRMDPFGNDSAEREAQTGPDGRFTLADLTPGIPVLLVAAQPGFVTGDPFRVAAPGESEVRLVLAAAARLSGRVVDGSGEPVASAMVTATPAGARTLNQFRGPSGYTSSDELGRFSFDTLEAGRVEIAAQAEGHMPAEPKAVELAAGREVSGVELVVLPGATLEGQVLAPGGQPVDGAQVSLERREETSLSLPRFHDSTRTDGDGRFRLTGVPPGSHTLVAGHDHYLRGVKDVEARAGSTSHVEIRLGEGLTLSGRVVDGGGSPVAGAGVSLGAEADSKYLEKWTEADGGFRFTGLSPGGLRLRAQKEGYTEARLDDLRLADAPLDGIELRLGKGATIAGRITGLSYAELTQVQVMARGERTGPGRGEVDFEGQYRITGLAPGEWTVAAVLPATGRTANGKVQVPAAGAEVTLDLEFTGGLSLAGRVVQGGEPLANATVGARAEGLGAEETGGASTVTDGAGGFRLEGLKPGTYRLRVSQWEAGVRHQEKETIELTQSRADVLIDVPGATLVRGRVLEAGTQSPVSGVSLSFEQEGDDTARFFPRLGNAGETDAEGIFGVNAPPGRYRIVARKEGYSPGEAQVEVTAGSSPPEVRISLTRATGLALEVVGLGGFPPSRVYAALVDAGGRAVVAGTFTPGEDGRIQLSQAPPGSFTALVGASGSATVTAPVTVPGGTTRVALSPPARLTVRVPALAGDSQGGTLTLTGADGQPFRSVRWGGMVQQEWPLPGGQAVIEDLPPGRYSVSVKTPGGRTWQGTAVTGGEPVTQVLE